jgi:hypothetical protein
MTVLNIATALFCQQERRRPELAMGKPFLALGQNVFQIGTDTPIQYKYGRFLQRGNEPFSEGTSRRHADAACCLLLMIVSSEGRFKLVRADRPGGNANGHVDMYSTVLIFDTVLYRYLSHNVTQHTI